MLDIGSSYVGGCVLVQQDERVAVAVAVEVEVEVEVEVGKIVLEVVWNRAVHRRVEMDGFDGAGDAR